MAYIYKYFTILVETLFCNVHFDITFRYITEIFLQKKDTSCADAGSCSRHGSISSAITFALPSLGAQTAPGNATLTRMPRRAFAQTTTGLTATGRICSACGLTAEGVRDASMSESDSRYATPLSVGVYAYRGTAP